VVEGWLASASRKRAAADALATVERFLPALYHQET
jgi:hypothetical protein